MKSAHLLSRLTAPIWLLAMAAVATVGCSQPAASQSPPIQGFQTAKGGSSTTDNKPSASVKPEATARTEPTADTVRQDKPESKQGPDAAPPSRDVPTRQASTRPKADREVTADGVEKITFDDLILGMDPNMVFRPWMLESEANGGRAKELEGKRIRLPGVMYGGLQSGKKNKEFVLLRNKECKFGPGGQADHVAQVLMKEGKTVGYTADTVRVEGTLRITPSTGDDGNTWYLYTIEDAELK